MTYNILAHVYTVGWFALHYDHDLSLLQDWKYRAERVMMEIEADKPELLCLQEVDHYEQFYRDKLAKLGYKAELVWRRNKDAVLIAYRNEFTLLHKAEVRHDDLADRYGMN